MYHYIKARCKIKGPITNEETIAFLNAVMNDPLYGFLLQNYLVKKQVVDSNDEVGAFVQISIDELISSSNAHEMEIHDNIVSTIAIFSLQFVVGISKICNECDNWNSSTDQLPPVLPLELCSVLLLFFLFAKYLDVEVEKIDDQFCKLHLAFKEQSRF